LRREERGKERGRNRRDPECLHVSLGSPVNTMQKVNMRSAEWTQGKQDRHMGIGKWRVAHLACEYREGGRKKQVTGGGSNVAAENEESEN
jgi:hypothetical protein